MMRVSLFTRKDCRLCEDVKAELDALRSEFPHELIEVDIESDPILHQHYAELIPVLKVGPYTLEAPIDATQLRVTLAAAQTGWKQEPASAVAKRPRRRAIGYHKVLLFIAKHWLALINLFTFLYVGLPFSAPLLMEAGAKRPAGLIYSLYSPLCHQYAFRSWFLFGEQHAYPLEIADTDLSSYGEVTGFDEYDYWGAREYTGSPRVGYKVALCQRDVAIYGGIFLSGLLFALLRGRLKPLPIGFWFLIGVLPIAIDGGTQFLAAIPIGSFPIRESTPFLRTVTGLMFGVANVWLAYPYLEETMQELRIMVAEKLARTGEAP